MGKTSDKEKLPPEESTDDQRDNGRMSSEELDKLDAVRDLLFGQNVKEYRGEFKELKDMLVKHREEVETLVSKTKSEIMDKLSQIDNKLNERIDETNDAKTGRQDLAQLLKDMASRLES